MLCHLTAGDPAITEPDPWRLVRRLQEPEENHRTRTVQGLTSANFEVSLNAFASKFVEITGLDKITTRATR